MSAVSPKECPVCQDPYDTDANLPKVFGNCGHTVCAVCLPGCVRRQGQATCPLCRQETPIPPNGLPTIYVLKDILEAEQAAGDAANISCSDCGDFIIPASAAFVCKTCTDEEVVVVCGFCGMRGHRAHDVVQYGDLASGDDIASLVSDEEQHNDMMQRQTTELASTIADEMKRIAKDCEIDVVDYLSLSNLLMTKEELERRAKESSERRLRGTRALEAAKKMVTRCHRKLSKVRTDDAQASGEQQEGPSKKKPKLARAPY